MSDFTQPSRRAAAPQNFELEVAVENNYIVYLLHNSENPCTYIGSTNNPMRRIRQHNGELVGGARYTHRNKPENDAGKWEYYGYIPGLDKHRALSIEKRIQIRSRKMKDRRAIDRRLRAIEQILADVNNPEIKFCIGNPIFSGGAAAGGGKERNKIETT